MAGVHQVACPGCVRTGRTNPSFASRLQLARQPLIYRLASCSCVGESRNTCLVTMSFEFPAKACHSGRSGLPMPSLTNRLTDLGNPPRSMAPSRDVTGQQLVSWPTVQVGRWCKVEHHEIPQSALNGVALCTPHLVSETLVLLSSVVQ